MNQILAGNICYSKSVTTLASVERGYLICKDGESAGVFAEIPEQYRGFPLTDYGDCLIIPGLCDLHIHAPQYSYRGLGMDLELLDWLKTYTFPEEAKFADLAHAERAYGIFADALKRGATTRAGVFATIHPQATELLMEKLDAAGLVTYVGKLNMDRNSPDYLREETEESVKATGEWIARTKGKLKNTSPILSPRFVPTCSSELMRGLKELQKEHGLPVQSHLSENHSEIAWVRELHPESGGYGQVYNSFGLFGGESTPTIMAHCVWSKGSEEALLRDNGVFVAHCPQSNTNLASGIAPVRRFLQRGIRVGLGTDVAGGCHASIFRAMSDAIQASKLYWRLIDQNDTPLTVPEAFYLGTLGGGAFFGKVGSFEPGYEFDAVVIDDTDLATIRTLSIEDRLARIIYLSEDSQIRDKYVRGYKIQ
ncbi:MAG: amidohydrolase family protein [Oscillospiraceae bacterium]|nr:amidohydrolase family protein [Oscillospiraceae bacterium]